MITNQGFVVCGCLCVLIVDRFFWEGLPVLLRDDSFAGLTKKQH